MLSRDAEEAQSVQNRHLEATHLAELRVNVQGVTVPRESVQRRLLLCRLLLDDGIGRALRRLVHGGSRAAVSPLGVSTERARPADEHGGLVVEDFLAGGGIDGGGALDDDAGGALVHDLDELGVGDELGGGGDGVFADFEELLAVEEHHGGEVGDDVVEGVGGDGVELGDDAEGGVDLEVVVGFEDEGEVGSFGADTEVCGGLAWGRGGGVGERAYCRE